jgi:SAM-dependent methyltransferase
MNFRDRLYQSYVVSQVRFDPKDLARRRPYLSSIVRRFIPPNKAIRIVDLGCGYGAVLQVLQEQGYLNSSGVDTSPQQVELAAKLGIKGVSIGGIVEYLHGIESGSVGVAIVFDVLEHLTRDELFEIGDEIHRVLVPGGICLVHAPNADGLRGASIRYGDLTHERAFTRGSLEQFASVVGMEMTGAYEEAPVVHGVKSFVRYAIWKVGTFPIRLLAVAETGAKPQCLSANFLAVLKNK